MFNSSKIKRFFSDFKWPSKAQWGQFFKILNKKEKIFFFSLLILFLGSCSSNGINFYIDNTEIKAAQGGTFIEGVVGQPRYINPIYASSNDVDRDLVELIFAGIMKYDENGQIIPDLAKEVKIEDDGKTYRVYLKENMLWSDSDSSNPQKITSEDIIFTIQTIQDPNYKSPLAVNWVGIEMERISDYEMIFRLNNPYSAFLENLTLKILPEHVWKNITSQDFPLTTTYNLNPVSSGPYKIEKLKRDSSGRTNSLILKINSKYFGQKPHLVKIEFKFFETEKGLTDAAKKGEIDGFSLLGNYDSVKNGTFQDYHFSLPRYFAVFFNSNNSKTLSDINVRQALNYGTNKQEILYKILDSQGKIIDSPILSEIYGFNPPNKTYQYDLEKAKQLLDAAGFKETESGIREKIVKKEPAFQFKSLLKEGSVGTEVRELQTCLAKFSDIYPSGEITGSFGPKTKAALIKFQEKYKSEILTPSGYTSGTGSTGGDTRKKLNELCANTPEEAILLKISLITVNQPMLTEVAEILKDQWKVLGVELNIQSLDNAVLERDIIKPRNYETLLFGEAMGKIPDPFPFWDSLQKKDPGLNLAVYENKNADKALESARQTLDDAKRQELLEKFQNILISDAPALFLYSPDYVYLVSKEIKGIGTTFITNPSKRFSNIENWYIVTKRTWK